MEAAAQCVALVLIEMGLSFTGIVFNLLIVATLRQEETLRGSTLNFLLLNLCFSNLLISFLVKPISAIYVGYAISTGEWHVGLAFCTLYTFTYRTTWCVFPFTIVALCWCKLLGLCKCQVICDLLCCAKRRKKRKEKRELNVERTRSLRQSELAFLGPSEQTPPPSTLITDLALKYRPGFRHQYSTHNLLSVSAMMSRGDSVSTTSPSTTTDNCQQIAHSANIAGEEKEGDAADAVAASAVAGNGTTAAATMMQGPKVASSIDFNTASTFARKPTRTMEEGPTTKQKVMVSFIWIGSAFFGIATCFPDKVFGVALSQKIKEDQLRTMAPSMSSPFAADLDLTYCTVKTGVNDFLDYIAIVISLVIPLILGPGLAGVGQILVIVLDVILPSFCRLCRSPAPRLQGPSNQMEAGITSAAAAMAATVKDGNKGVPENEVKLKSRKKGPGWGIIVCFTLAFVTTYPVHMYVAEVYLTDNFTFLFIKYCIGFLFVLLVPVIALILEGDIRKGIRSVFGSAVMCLQNVPDDDVEAKVPKGQEQKQQQQQPQPIVVASSSEDGLEMEVEGKEEGEGEESRQMIEKTGD